MFFKKWLEAQNDFEVIIPKGTKLYHGTIELFDTRNLNTGSYDEVFWTSDNIEVARRYIPESSLKTILTIKSILENENIKKQIGLNSLIVDGARKKAYNNLKLFSYWDEIFNNYSKEFKNYEKLQKDDSLSDDFFDRWKEAEENRIKYSRGYDYEDYLKPFILKKMKNLGYNDYSSNYFKDVKITINDKILPANYRAKGKVLELTCKKDLKMFDISSDSGGDLLNLQYHHIKTFREAEKKGYDGIIIDDFVDGYGHKSFGFFKNALENFHIREIRNQTHFENYNKKTILNYEKLL